MEFRSGLSQITGSCFTSAEFESFCMTNGITHTKQSSTPSLQYGLAKQGVQTVKEGMKKIKREKLEEKLQKFLMAYQNTPHTTTGVTLVESLLGLKLETLLDHIHPDLSAEARSIQAKQKYQHDQQG